MILKICVLIACAIAMYNVIANFEKTGGTLKGVASIFVLLTLATMASKYF